MALVVPYGHGQIEFTPPPGFRYTVIESRVAEALPDPRTAIANALSHPVGAPPLSELAHRGQRVCIVFTDMTRACPDHLLVPALLDELKRAGVGDEDITLLCATGLHRPSTHEEKVGKLGAEIVSRHRVIDNEPRNPEALIGLGVTSSGLPVSVHRSAAESDLLIATGIVEPHQYAGYSGGWKTLAIGAAGESLIAHTHGPAFVDHPGSRLGRVEGNPFQEAVVEAGRIAELQFVLNVVLDDHQRIVRVGAGEPSATFNQLVAFARSIFEVPIPRQYDVAIGGVGFPKDSNLYQATRAASYLYFAPTPVVRPGGVLIIPARCEEGAGAGVGEQRFLSAMRDAPTIEFILDDARRNGYPPGQQRAFVMAKVLEQVDVIIVGSEHPDQVEACKMIPAATIDEAFDFVTRKLGQELDLLVVPHALLTLPIVMKTWSS